MFPSIRRKSFVVVACLLCSLFVGPTAFAGLITPSQITGDYETNLGQQNQIFPLNYLLENGSVSFPIPLQPLTPANMDVTETQSSSGGTTAPTVTVSLSDFILSGTVLGMSNYIDYTSNSPQLVGSSEIRSEVSLNTTSSSLTTVDLVNLNPAVLTITFPSSVLLDPSWPAGFSGPVEWSLTPVPEPAAVVQLAWVGAIGVVRCWRRYRRVARAAAA
jgi:hypothetical protein